METALDKFIEAMPENRNDKCPCGCGTKMKKLGFVDNFDEHVEAHSKQNKEIQ